MISVIIPTYNRAIFLSRAIKSVLSQTFEDLELFVVDDGSTDNTRELVQEYERKDKRVAYIHQEHSGGAARPKNTAIRQAKGEYIAILDSDDEWLPGKLELQLQVFAQSANPKLRAVNCDVVIVEDKTGEEEKYRVPRYNNVLRQLLMRDYMGPGSCMLYKKEVFDEVGLFDEQLRSGQDREMRIRIVSFGYDIGFADDYLVRYYIGHDNISTALHIEKREKDWNYIFEKYREYYEKDRSLWSDKLRYDGSRYILLGELTKGRKRFIKSIIKNPFNTRSVVALLLSLFGRRVYEALARYKMRLANRFL